MKRTLAPIFRTLALIALVVICLLPEAKVFAAGDGEKTPTPTPTPIQDYVNKEQYLSGYYRGYVTSDSATVRTGPGTKAYPELKLDDGTVVKLTKNTEVFVYGETKDVDLDVWYHITATFKGQEIEGYIYIKRVKRENTQIPFTPTPMPSPTPTTVPVLTEDPGEVTGVPGEASPTPTLPPNIEEVKNSPSSRKWIPILVVSLIVLALVLVYALYQRIQEKKLEEEMERYSKRRPAMERLDGEDEEDFKEAKKKYYASMNFGHEENRRKTRTEDDVKLDSKFNAAFEDDEVDEDDVKLGFSKKRPARDDVYDIDDISDDDMKVVNDFRKNGATGKLDDSLDVSDDDLAYFDRLKGKTEAPSGSAIAKAGSASSILDETPKVDSYFEADEPTPEERLRMRIDSLRAGDRISHKLYGDGSVVDNSDSEISQVRFGRDLRFLKKDKLAKKELVEL